MQGHYRKNYRNKQHNNMGGNNIFFNGKTEKYREERGDRVAYFYFGVFCKLSCILFQPDINPVSL